MRPVELTKIEWDNIKEQMMKLHKPSSILIREKMKTVHGFVPRDHSSYIDGVYRQCVMLDFYSESKRTMFLLTYGDFIKSE